MLIAPPFIWCQAIDPNAKKVLRVTWSYSSVGLFFGVAIALGFLAGRWLDRRFHTAPWLGLIGVLFGVAAGFRELFRVAAQYRRDLESDKSRNGK